jgi:hypothetical protein
MPADGVTACIPGAVLAPAPTPEAAEVGRAPVFVDDSGARKRLLRIAGVLIALLSVTFLAVVGVALAVPSVTTSVGAGGVVPFIVPDAAAPPPPRPRRRKPPATRVPVTQAPVTRVPGRTRQRRHARQIRGVRPGPESRIQTRGHRPAVRRESHRIDFNDLVGESVWLYPQNEVFVDLAAARERDGGEVHFSVADAEVLDLTADAPKIRFNDSEGNAKEIHAQILVGADGSGGICKWSIPQEHRTDNFVEYPFAWFGILCEAPPAGGRPFGEDQGSLVDEVARIRRAPRLMTRRPPGCLPDESKAKHRVDSSHLMSPCFTAPVAEAPSDSTCSHVSSLPSLA